MKYCRKVNKNKKGAKGNKVSSFSGKVFTKKSNRDQHVKNFHTHENFDKEIESYVNNLYKPTMAEIPCMQYIIEASS